jgi:hypothetical protein
MNMNRPWTGRNHPFGLDYECDMETEKTLAVAVAKEEEGAANDEECEFEGPTAVKEEALTKTDEVSNKSLFSKVWLSYNDSFDNEIFAAYQESIRTCEQKKDVDYDTEEIKSKDVVAVTDDEDKKAEEPTDIIKECRFCGKAPCLVHNIYAEMMWVAAGMEDEVEDKKEIRHAIYSLVAKKLFGRLGKGVRKQIPHCIVAEIHEAYPAKNKDGYIGFKEACDNDE